MKHCKWCDHTFETDIAYQIYCSEECRDLATKEKIAARYLQTRRQKRKGKERKCKFCGSKLSIYNDDVLCSKCNINPNDVAKALKNIKGKTK
jgi:predicted nucleic acid-binding Zn ribbon protein